MPRCTIRTDTIVVACTLTSIVVYGQEQVLFAIILERCFKVNDGPSTSQIHRTTEHPIAFCDNHPVTFIVECRFRRVRKVDVIVTLTPHVVIIECNAGNHTRFANLIIGVNLLTRGDFFVGTTR